MVGLCAASAAAQETLTCGVPVLRTLAPDGIDTYRLSAAPGATVTIQASSVSPALGPVSLQLSGPGVSISTCTGLISFVGASGDFTLRVSQCGGGTTGGEYTLALSVVSDDASNCGQPLPCGATPDGTGFSVPGAVDSFTVSLAQGQQAEFKANYPMPPNSNMLYPYLRLYDPDGNEVNPGVVSGRCAGTMSFTPSPGAGGTYTVLVSTCGPPETLAYRLEFYQPGCPPGPTITTFGVLEGVPEITDVVQPIGYDTARRPIYNRAAGEGFLLVVEARAGHDGQSPGDSTVPYLSGGSNRDPDVQMILSHPLGDGDPTVCDVTPPNLGGVPGTVPFDFTSDPNLLDHIDDMGCRFNNGQGMYVGVRDSSEACSFTGEGFGYSFVDRGSGIQYCAQIASAWAFLEGDTIVAARVKDAKLGNFGAPREIVVRIGDPSPATPTPTVTRTPPATRMASTPTRTRTRTPTRTPVAGTPTTTPTGPTPTVTETPTGSSCVGDCAGAGVVTIDDLVRMVNIAIGAAPLTECPAGDPGGTGQITIDDLVQGVNALLNGCPVGAGG